MAEASYTSGDCGPCLVARSGRCSSGRDSDGTDARQFRVMCKSSQRLLGLCPGSVVRLRIFSLQRIERISRPELDTDNCPQRGLSQLPDDCIEFLTFIDFTPPDASGARTQTMTMHDRAISPVIMNCFVKARAAFPEELEPSIDQWEKAGQLPENSGFKRAKRALLLRGTGGVRGAGADFLYNMVLSEEVGYAIGGASVAFRCLRTLCPTICSMVAVKRRSRGGCLLW